MDIRELRIGNYVKVSDKICHVVSILSKSSANTFERVIVEDCNGIHSGGLMEIIEPIPLTEDILLKCGFEKIATFTVMDSLHLYFDEHRCVSISNIGTPNEMMWLQHIEDNKVSDLVRIHNYDYDGYLHLHQLQNLIFVLSGKELEINL